MLFAFLLAIGLPVSAADEVAVRAHADRATVNLDETLQYSVEVMRSGAVRTEPEVRLPDFGAAGFEAVSTMSSTNMVMAGQDVRLTTQYVYVLRPTRIGETTIAGPEVSYRAGGGKKASARGEAVQLLVLPAGGLRDLKGPMRVPARAWPLGVALLGIVVLAYTGWRIWKRNTVPARSAPAPNLPALTPEAAALAALAAARALRLQGDVAGFYVSISDALREYLHRKLEVPTREATTREILRGLERKHLSPALRRELSALLDESDAVKFAKFSPTPEQMDASHLQSVAFVQRLAAERASPEPATDRTPSPGAPARPPDASSESAKPVRTARARAPRAAKG